MDNRQLGSNPSRQTGRHSSQFVVTSPSHSFRSNGVKGVLQQRAQIVGSCPRWSPFPKCLESTDPTGRTPLSLPAAFASNKPVDETSSSGHRLLCRQDIAELTGREPTRTTNVYGRAYTPRFRGALLFGFRNKSQSGKQRDSESTAQCGKGAEGVCLSCSLAAVRSIFSTAMQE